MEGSGKIGFFRYSLLNRGGDRIVVDYANFLAECGYEVSFYTVRNETVFAVSSKVSVELLPCSGEIDFVLYGARRNFGADLLIVDIIHLPLPLSLRNRVLYLAQAYDVEYYEQPLQRVCIDLLYRAFFYTGCPTIAVSESLATIFRKKYSAEKVYTVTNGISLSTFFSEPDQELLQLKRQKKSLLLLARGDRYRKGFDLAMQLLPLLANDYRDTLEIWCCGDELPELVGGCSVRNFGVVSDERMRSILSSADIFLYPSRHEGFGLFPLEAMACGAVVVTTDAIPYGASIPCMRVSNIGDINGMTGHIRELLDQPDLLARLRAEGLVAARGYDSQLSKQHFAELVSRLSSEGRL